MARYGQITIIFSELVKTIRVISEYGYWKMDTNLIT